jgi:hypothetical protein
MMKKPLRIISGGQTGVDRAALDVAMALCLPCGGWCPRGRRAEDGAIPLHYPMKEMDSPRYIDRTRQNVSDADATLILTWGEVTGGTAATLAFALEAAKPHLVVDLTGSPAHEEISQWIDDLQLKTLNVAGPRGSRDPQVYPRAREVLEAALGARAG